MAYPQLLIGVFTHQNLMKNAVDNLNNTNILITKIY